MESICSGIQCSEEWGSITFSLFFRYVPAARRFLLDEVTPVPLRSRRTENIVERFLNGEWSWLTRYLGCRAELFYMFELGFARCFNFAE
ncbi:TPA: hypothetical protein ACKP97_000019 [Pseudomonas aeruginosa]|uniref:hypothetical protein n=1 Tax=Pseudomonas aeruginosa TaxID=287 RepID=UPI000FD8DC3B|nr:hypothetical protein [Pseudomonas aeruginosa]EKN9353321.1 hypothetical protein [Pseudomonas aeruginosa]MBG5162562.1 hypothetical protein [Pseudomonas aeruginosa]MBS9751666.1 hypothetical protein [Pseudomonas aeruginosa]MBX6652861.1 hypothetical protein [Pseudomonas aeruginosa]MBX6813434.1 hypothetical protein [Pseudomonas aeruginosa]